RIDRRKNFVQFSLQSSGLHRLFTGAHLIHISPDRIDLSVVYDKTVRMCPLPARRGIGTESGMHHGDRRLKILILQILKEPSQLTHKEHSFVNDRPAGKRYYIGIVTALLKDSSDNRQSSVKGKALFHFFR